MRYRNITIVLLILVSVTAIISQSCNGDGASKPVISGPNSNKSHYTGKDCMSCHTEKGKAPPIFTVGASVLDEARLKMNPNAVIKLYTWPGGGGKLVATILGDGLGNFYTTEQIDFSNGLYPELTGSPGAAEGIKYMKRATFSGNCNGCHGIVEERLGID